MGEHDTRWIKYYPRSKAYLVTWALLQKFGQLVDWCYSWWSFSKLSQSTGLGTSRCLNRCLPNFQALQRYRPLHSLQSRPPDTFYSPRSLYSNDNTPTCAHCINIFFFIQLYFHPDFRTTINRWEEGEHRVVKLLLSILIKPSPTGKNWPTDSSKI